MPPFPRRAVTLVLFLASAAAVAAQNSPAADEVWAQEQDYWRLVKANDLSGYRALWDVNFLGWPSSSAEPVRKPHITDWITAHTDKGESLQSYDLERLTIQLTGDLGTATYRVRTTWVDKQGTPITSTIRILHTWRRIPRTSEWQIVAGMSAGVNSDGH